MCPLSRELTRTVCGSTLVGNEEYVLENISLLVLMFLLPWHFGANPDPDPDPTPDPTPFFIDFMDAKNIFFIFFLLTLFCMHYFSLLNTFMRKGKDWELDPDPYL